MAITKELFGKLDCGSEIISYTLANALGMSVKILNLGGIISELHVPDSEGNIRDVVCGFDSLDAYLKAGGYQGALIGRVGNRIGKGQFTLNGVEYSLFNNDGRNHLHGGKVGFDKKIWSTIAYEAEGNSYLELKYQSSDGEENYPGTLDVTVTYTLTSDNKLSINYQAATDKSTIVNMTNHAYFNLSGYEKGNIGSHELWIDSDEVTVTDDALIPIGKNLSVEGTPFDFTKPKLIGLEIDADNKMIKQGGGYDHNFFLKPDGTVKLSAKLYSPESKIAMKMYTNQPCVQIYTANMINVADRPFKKGIAQTKRCGVCLETQAMPDSINCPGFTNIVLNPGELYDYTTVFEFGIE